VDYEEFYAQSYPMLRRLAFARTGDRGAAEDLVQDALADAHRRWSEIQSYREPMAWARRAVLNRSVSRWRRRGREAAALQRVDAARSDSVADAVAFRDEELWAAIRRLPRRQLEVVILLWFEELSTDQVAATLGCGSETVRTHWRRARASLKHELEAEAGRTEPQPTGPGAGDASGGAAGHQQPAERPAAQRATEGGAA
jgi:RNA polymerase sigma-70 factor (sigma-E family)